MTTGKTIALTRQTFGTIVGNYALMALGQSLPCGNDTPFPKGGSICYSHVTNHPQMQWLRGTAVALSFMARVNSSLNLSSWGLARPLSFCNPARATLSSRAVKTSLHGNCRLRRCCRLNVYVEVLSLSTLQNVNVLGDKVFKEVCACMLSCFTHVQLFVTPD